MKVKQSPYNATSLVQHFAPPENFIGHFGWLCGYSADPHFLNCALEVFSQKTFAARASQGNILLAAMLDPSNAHITPVDVPSLAHLAIKTLKNKPFRLLHAKVAVLGFKNNQENTNDKNQWHLRLIVSTGNWTQQKVEKSLDLAWSVDISDKMLNEHKNKAEMKLQCTDLKAAMDMLEYLEELFDTKILTVNKNNENAIQQVKDWVNKCKKNSSKEVRFFENRKTSLFKQLPYKIEQCGGKVKRNHLSMGSGFYESFNEIKKSLVPIEIMTALIEEGHLTKTAEVNIFVNSKACQAIASSSEILEDKVINVREANTPNNVFPLEGKRFLHAKFLFSANEKANSLICNSAWVYLGSGNLTNPGFMNKMGNKGNLEAGVVFAPMNLIWKNDKKETIPKNQIITNLLPIQFNTKFNDDNNEKLESGEEMPLQDDVFFSAPISFLNWHVEKDGNFLSTNEDLDFKYNLTVLDSANQECTLNSNGYKWLEKQPRQVSIQWQYDKKTYTQLIPVIDQFGRIAATELRLIDVTDALWLLTQFPNTDEAIDDYPQDNNSASQQQNAIDIANNKNITLTYPIRIMMQLIESIAEKQTKIKEQDWLLWCARLEQILFQAKASPQIQYFKELGINPLSPLYAAPFRPRFAENNRTPLGVHYEKVLSKIEHTWEVDKLNTIGEV